jgi:acetyl-CoA carboxylase biotin carboxyl carrier protein
MTNRGEKMDLNTIKKLVKLLSESEVDEIEIEEEGKKIRVAKHPANKAVAPMPPPPYAALPVHPPGFHIEATSAPVPPWPATAPQATRLDEPAPAPAPAFHEIRSPIVGTFYRAPAPDAAPFIQVGSLIEPGTVLCIVEAMKLMNEIESDVSGKIAKILVENGQPVEYGQVLFHVEK